MKQKQTTNNRRVLEMFEKAGVLELDAELQNIYSKKARLHRFMERVDNRDTDPDYTQEQMDAEDKKYTEGEKEIPKLEAEIERLHKELDDKLVEAGFSKWFDAKFIL